MGSNYSWPIRGLAAGAANIFVGWIVTLIFAALLWSSVDWALELERRGTDAAMRWTVLVHGPIVEPIQDSQAIDPIVFLDIDEAGCTQLSSPEWDCRSNGVGNPELLRRLGLALRESGARLLVLDVNLPGRFTTASSEDVSSTIAAWRDGAGPETVAALPSVQGAGRTVRADSDLARRSASGRLTLAPAIVWQDVGGESIIRSYPIRVNVSNAGEGPGGELLISLPFLATDRLSANNRVETASSTRILYTLPALSIDENAWLHADYLGTFEHRRLSRMITTSEGFEAEIQVGGLEGQVVIIGSSAPSAADRHQTPLGVMTGAEVLANVIRSNQLLPVIESQQSQDSYWRKIWRTLPAAGIVMIAWLCIAFVTRKRAGSRTHRIRQYALVCFIFSTALVASISIAIWSSLSGFEERFSTGENVDILLPTIALFLEGLVEFLGWISHQLKIVAAELLLVLKRSISKLSERT